MILADISSIDMLFLIKPFSQTLVTFFQSPEGQERRSKISEHDREKTSKQDRKRVSPNLVPLTCTGRGWEEVSFTLAVNCTWLSIGMFNVVFFVLQLSTASDLK